jgi:Tfp pilus assembly protein PilF
MDNGESTAGLSHLFKNALPLVGRIGAIVGGIFSLLAVLERVSGEIITAVEGLLLFTAIISSAIVVLSRTSKTLDDQTLSVPHFSRINRTIAAIFLVGSSALMVAFVARIGIDAINRQQREGLAIASRTPPADRTRFGTVSTLAAAATPATPTLAPTLIPIPLSQITDVTLLNRMGYEALAAKDHIRAVNLFSRALQVDATNANSQLGLGEAYYFSSNEGQAFNAFRIALQLNPSLVDAHAYLGFIYDHRQDSAKAKAEYEEFLRLAPRENALLPSIRERLNQLTGRAPFPSLTPLITSIATNTITPTITTTASPSILATLTLTPTATPSISATLTISPTTAPSATPTRTATPK